MKPRAIAQPAPSQKCRSKIPQVIGPPSQDVALGMVNCPSIPLLHGPIGKLWPPGALV